MGWPVRYRIIGLLFCGTVVNYIDRVNISVAAPSRTGCCARAGARSLPGSAFQVLESRSHCRF